ncbi:MAG: hypothetical protein ACRDWI_17460, partial [Jiangellaceae bacterium]
AGAELQGTGLYSQRSGEHVDFSGVRTIAVTIPEDLDQRAAAEARRRGISKSELIRHGLAAVLPDSVDEPESDLWRSLAGFGSDDLRVEPGEIDRTVYWS